MKRLVVGIGGASGSIYAQRLLSRLADRDDVDVRVVISKMGRVVWNSELDVDVASFGFPIYAPGDLAATCASGSATFDGMVILPCSAGGLARIAHGISSDLLSRTADVMLKERRPLLLVLRESPYNLVQLKNMVAVTEAGAVIIPASPSFYSNPSSIDDLVDTIIGRVLDHLGLDHDVTPRWSGLR